MALTRPFPIDQAYPNASDLRKQASAIYPREGIFPDPVTILPAGIAYGNAGWNVGARPFVANLKRGGAPFSQAYGSAQISNDAAGTAWTIAPAPASGARVDRLWIKALDPGQGDALNGETPPRAVPAYGVTAGTPGIQPLPAGCLEIAQVSTPSTATSIAQSTITQTYGFANVLGGMIYARTEAVLDSMVGIQGERAFCLDDLRNYQHSGTAWVPLSQDQVFGWVPYFSTVYSNSCVLDTVTGIVTLTIKAASPTAVSSGSNIGLVPPGFRPPATGIEVIGAASEGGAAGPVLYNIGADGNVYVYNNGQNKVLSLVVSYKGA